MFQLNHSLPITEAIPEVLSQFQKNDILLLTAPPGAGKSTYLPLVLLNEPWMFGRQIILLEPRRLAARSVASRMAEMLGDQLGNQIGFRIRFESCESDQTRILVVTEGILIRMLQDNPSLNKTSLIIFDEFHERSLQADVSLLLSLESKKIFRPDLKILIMSATLQTEKLSKKLGAPIIRSAGRAFEISYRYLGAETGVALIAHIGRAIQLACNQQKGDILVFLPGTGEIIKVSNWLESSEILADICPLYGDLPFAAQQKAILPNANGRRRIILATSVAETSLTIEGVSVVIDAGLSRVAQFDPQSGLTRLITLPVTKDAAAQRAGRAGRLGPGVCYRLWEENQTKHLVSERKPEILEADLAPVVLDLLNWGTDDFLTLDWIDLPPQGHFNQALELLMILGAIDSKNKLTKKGREMSRIPLHPRLSNMLFQAKDSSKLLMLSCDIAAILEERDPLSKNSGADLCLRIRELARYRRGEQFIGERQIFNRIDRLANQFRKLMGLKNDDVNWPEDWENKCGELLAAAYPDRIGRQIEQWGRRYQISNGRILCFDEGDPMTHYQWVVMANASAGTSEGKIFLATGIDEDLIPGPERVVERLIWDEEHERVLKEFQFWKVSLLVSRRVNQELLSSDCSPLLIEKIREKGFAWAGVSEGVYQIMARIHSLYLWTKTDCWNSFSEPSLIQNMDVWLSPFLNGIRSRAQLQKLDWRAIFLSKLSYEQQALLNTLMPERIQVPSGSFITIQYFMDGRTPELHVRLQEVFGCKSTPTVNDGKMPLMIHLLSPAYRPVQITRDLNSFWNGAYHDVRKELRARYPKHSWPEDPLKAMAVRGVKRK